MKARVFKTESQIRKIVQDEARKQTEEIWEKAAAEHTYQSLAVAFVVLNREFGFGKERLRKLKDKIEDEFMAMKLEPLGRKYSPDDCIRLCKEKFGIDFGESQYGESWDKELERAEKKKRRRKK